MNQDLKSRVEKLFNQFEALRKSGKDILPLDEEFLSIVKELTTREEKLVEALKDVQKACNANAKHQQNISHKVYSCFSAMSHLIDNELRKLSIGDDDDGE